MPLERGSFRPRQSGAVIAVCARSTALEIDACFTVEPDRLRLEFTQRVTEPLPVLEAEAWRLGWNLRAGMTACATAPTLRPGRNGEVALPACWAACEAGRVALRIAAG